MANYEVPENPQFDENIRKLENTDPASAEKTFNPLFQQIITNVAAVKKETEGKAETNLSNVPNEAFKMKSIEAGIPENVAEKAELDEHTQNKQIHVTQQEKTSWNDAVNASTASAMLAKIKTVDGANSGLDADMVDGKHAADLQNYNNLANKPAIMQNLVDGNATGAIRTKNAKSDYTMGQYSTAMGEGTIATGDYSTAIGYYNMALGKNSMAIGSYSMAYGDNGRVAIGVGAIAAMSENVLNITNTDLIAKKLTVDVADASKLTDVSAGQEIYVRGLNSLSARIMKFTISEIDAVNRTITINDLPSSNFTPYYAVVIKGNVDNTPNFSFGNNTTAAGVLATALGNNTVASGTCSTAMGYSTKAIGLSSTAMGSSTKASGNNSTAMGSSNEARGSYSTAMGQYNTTLDCQLALGHHNKGTDTGGSEMNTSGSALIIGNGITGKAKSNCFRVQYDGKTFAQGAYSATGADYAELFEWADGNPENQDRRGLFAALEGAKIKLANSPEDFIIGIVSHNPAVLGNNHSETWKDMYLTDMWGDALTQRQIIPAEYRAEEYFETETDENGEITEIKKEREILVKESYETDVPRLNPDYNPDEEYVPRHERKEWGTVGMFGQLVLQDNGVCQPGGYCVCSQGGVAVAASQGYYVMERINDTYIRVLFK